MRVLRMRGKAIYEGCNIQRRQDCNPTPFQRHSTGIGRIGAFRRGVEWRCLGLADWNWNWTAIPFHVGIGMAWRGEIFEFEGLEWRGVTPEKRFGIGTGLDNPGSNAVGVAWRGPLTQVKNWSRIFIIFSWTSNE